MAEIKNSFLSSKMNKDLDDRLIPNGEYRDALNISVGKSENSDIGTVQNILGNVAIAGATETTGGGGGQRPVPLTCIGFYMDNQNNRIYRFLTNYTDPTPSAITLPPADSVHKITVYDFNVPSYTTLVEGTFLNFSTTNLITGVNLLEGLLFFTDGRNQPRKINYANAINDPNYYTTETQISVAKYAPVEAPILFREVNTTASAVDGLDITVADATGITIGMTLISEGVTSCDYATVLNVDGNVVTIYSLSPDSIAVNDKLKFLTSTMSDQSNNPEWPGDPAYLESKYIRFSYRFKFDDNEYSVIAPFSQIAYIPKQKGYFINGDEQAAYRSTILKWMENNTNNVEVLIPLPDVGSNIRDSYKITGVEILYKESNSLAVKVLDTVSYLTISNSIGANTNIYTYQYQSQKPYKTLSEDQLTRVYDKVPTRAKTQELSGNRVIYGNFYTTYTPPRYIDYKVGAQPKNEAFTNFIEYPNHTLKQNRNYQAGFVLADKFGRQSSVILSKVDITTLIGNTSYGSSTIYSPYTSQDDPLFPGVKCWKGNALRVLVNNTIDSERNIAAGTPGLYAESINSGFAVLNASIDEDNFTYTFQVDIEPIPNPTFPTTIPKIGDYLRGKYTDYVEVTLVEWIGEDSPPITDPNDFPVPPSGSYIVTTDGVVSDLYLHEDLPIDIKYAYELNQIGWYSYKVVVKQREQDYYNVYLPGMLNGYPVGQTDGSQVVYNNTGIPALENGINITNFPTNETGKTSHIVLINDNINKVPRDLAEVGPDQKQYRSSVELYGRVENYPSKIQIVANPISATDYYASQITYNIDEYPDLINTVRAGDGIQCDIPLPSPGTTFPKWYGDTVITSISIFDYIITTVAISPSAGTIIKGPKFWDIQAGDLLTYDIAGVPYTGEVAVAGYAPTTGYITVTSALTVSIPKGTKINFTRPNLGIIKFSPNNPIFEAVPPNDAWVNFTITTAENWQYYPLRKADVVNTIAYATDFNFLSNTVDNITGTAGLNLYQLQSNPLVGRISTSKTIGTISDDMIPTLGIYETAPIESSLDLFWETSTTGLISDLNWAVLTDFNGASGTTPTGFNFWEDQDFDGSNNDPDDNGNTGDADSPFITDKFFILDNVNNEITPTNCQLFSVFNGNSVNVTNLFQLVTITGTTPSYRIKILNKFVFDNNANTNGVFNFTLRVLYDGITTNVTFSGRLKNRIPSFKPPVTGFNKTIDRTTTEIETIFATNGAFLPDPTRYNINGLYWSIINGNGDGNFGINPSTGMLSLIRTDAQLGYYELTIKVIDACDFTTNPPSSLINTDPNVSSKSTTTTVAITIGENPVDEFLEYWNGSLGSMPDYNAEFPEVNTAGYFGVYVGPTIDVNLIKPTLPFNIPISTTANLINVQVANGALGTPGFSSPTGLTKGALRFRWSLTGAPITHGIGKISVLIYYRPTPTSVWQIIKDDNYAGVVNYPWWGNEISIPSSPDTLKISVLNSDTNPRTVTGSIKVSQPGEYFFAVKAIKSGQEGPVVTVEDANYYYNRTGPDINDFYDYHSPFLPKERFMVGMITNTEQASAVPYTTSAAPEGFTWLSNSTTIVSLDPITPQTKFVISPIADSIKIVPGVSVIKSPGSTSAYYSKVVGFDEVTNTVTISPAIGAGGISVGTVINFRQLSYYKIGGNIWASSKDATFVNQFYSTANLNNVWSPPLSNSFYNFMSYVKGNPDLSTSPLRTDDTNGQVTAWNSAQIESTGAVTKQTLDYTIKTSHGDPNQADGAVLPFLTTVFEPGSISEESNYIWPEIIPNTITANAVSVKGLPTGSTGWVTWSTESTTPTKDYYPDQSVQGTSFGTGGTYTITGLTPNTVYYILGYYYSAEGYINGNYHPIVVRTLPA